MEADSTSPIFQTCRMDTTNMAYNIFNELRLEGQLCDVVIKVNGVEFNAHKNILCGCSSYFHDLFASVRHNAHVYTIAGTTPEMMRTIIDFAYTCNVTVTTDNVQQLLVAADQFCVPGLVQVCSDFLERQLCPGNCIGIYKFTDFYLCTDLHYKAFFFTLHHFEDVVEVSEELLELSLFQLGEMIERDEINVTREEVVYEAILRWVAHKPLTRKRSLPELLPKVRMALIDSDYFLNQVKNNPLVKDSEECELIVLRGSKALPRPRLPYNILLASGGWNNGSPTNVIEAYDTRANSWLTVGQGEKPRAYHGTVYLHGFVYFIGGTDGVGSFFRDVCKFNPITRTWHQVGPMHSRRCYVSVAILDGFIFAMGGFDGHWRIDTAERYEPETNQWTLVAPMHERRSDASAATLNGKVYICGGFTGNQGLCTAESYSPSSDQWTLIEPMASVRRGAGVVAYHNLLYAVGGFDCVHRLWTAEVYNPVDNSWRPIPHMHSARSNFGIEVVDNLLYVVGGYNGLGTTIDVEYYNDKTDSWNNTNGIAVSRSALSCCVVPGLPNVAEYTFPRKTSLHAGSEDTVPRDGPQAGSEEEDTVRGDGPQAGSEDRVPWDGPQAGSEEDTVPRRMQQQ